MPGIVSAARPVYWAMVCCALPLTAITAGLSIIRGETSKPTSASRVPVSSRPKVAVWTASSCRVP
jgi:hypothetical protein